MDDLEAIEAAEIEVLGEVIPVQTGGHFRSCVYEFEPFGADEPIFAEGKSATCFGARFLG